MPHPNRVALALICLLLTACGDKTPADPVAAADAALRAGRAPEAESIAVAALAGPAAQGDRALAWRLERLRLTALGAQGRHEDLVAAIAGLARTYPTAVDDQLYGALGFATLEAGHTESAIEVAEAGKAAFPERAQAFDNLIERIKERALASADDGAIARLKALGYL